MAYRNQHETPEMTEAFEFYYTLGDDRTLEKVARKFAVSERTIFNWSSSFNWRERVTQRDGEVADLLRQAVVDAELRTRLGHRKDIADNLDALRNTLNEAIKAALGKEGPVRVFNIEIKSAGDLKTIIDAYEKLVKLDLSAIGDEPAATAGANRELEQWFMALSPEEKREVLSRPSASQEVAGRKAHRPPADDDQALQSGGVEGGE